MPPLYIALGVAGGLLIADMMTGAIGRLQTLFTILIVSLFLSFAMEPAVQYMAARGMRRGVATMAVFFFVILLFVGFVAAMLPLVIDQVSSLVDSGPSIVERLADRAASLPAGLGESVQTWLEDAQTKLPDLIPDLASRITTGVLGFGSTLLGGLFQFLSVLLITFYLVADGARIRRALVSRLEPDRQAELLGVWELAIAKTGGYVYSRALLAFVSALFHWVAFSMIGLRNAVALGVWVGLVSSVIPVVGTYLAGALPLIIALARDPIDAVWVLAAIVVYQQVENYLVGPRITARTMELHPAIAFVAVLVGAALLGALGALLALPAAAIVVALISASGERHEIVAHNLLNEDTAPA